MSKRRRQIPNNKILMSLAEMPTGGASDVNLKKDIQTLRFSLDQLLKLRPVKWQYGTNSREYGFVSSEMGPELSDLVSSQVAEDGTEGRLVSTKELIPFLIAALQEQQKQIDSLSRQLNKEQ